MRGSLKKLFKKVFLIYILVTLIFSNLGISLSWAGPGSMAADYLFETGKHFYDVGRYQDALVQFKKVLLIDPTQKQTSYYINLIEQIEKKKISKPLPEDKEKIMEEVLNRFEQPLQLQMPIIKIYPEAAMLPPLIPKEIEPPAGMVILKPSAIAIERKGEIGLFIDGKEVPTTKPILIREGKILLPLRDVAYNLYFSLLDLQDGNFRIISPEGISKDIKVSFIEAEPMLTEREVQDYFSVDTYFQEPQKAFHIRHKSIPQFKTYTTEKSEEEIKKERALEEVIKKAALVPKRPTTIPEAARPLLELKGNLSRTYIDYHVSPTYHSLASNITGRLYDFNLRYGSLWRDINGVFDHDYTYLNLTRPDLYIGLFDQYIDLYPLRLQSQGFNGLKIFKEWGNLNKSTFVGGNIENTVSGTSGSVKYLGRIYGLRQDFKPLEWLDVKSAILYLENEAQIPALSGTTAFARNNLVSFSDVSLKLPYDFTVSSQLAHCYYYPDNALDTPVEDWDWRTATEWSKPRYKLGFIYEMVGDRYASLGNPANYQDYKGWNLYGNYRVTDNWSLRGNLGRYRDNIDDENRPTTYNTIFNLSSYHRLTKKQSVNLSFNRFISDPSGPNAGTSSETNFYRIDYFLPFLFDTRATVNYQFSRNDSGGAAGYYTTGKGGSLFKSFGRGSSWYLSQHFTNNYYKTAADKVNSNTAFNINYMFTPSLSLYLNSYYNRNRTEGSELSRTLSAASGFKYRIFPDTDLNCEYNINSYNLKTEKDRWPRHWSIMVYISQKFGLSTPLNFGIIEGYVFKDTDADGNFDYDEPPVEGAILYLEDKREIVTNPRGYFRFADVVPGRQKVHLDLSSLPSELTTKDYEREVEVKPRRSHTETFELVEASLIKGKVFIDDNLDSVFQDTEEPLEEIAVILLPVEQFRRTNSEGDFKFDYLLPGKYKVKIRLEDMPLGYELVSGSEIELDLAAGKEVKDANFVVKLQSVPVPVPSSAEEKEKL